MNIDQSNARALRPITNHYAMGATQPKHRLPPRAEPVRVSIDGTTRTGLWWPRTIDYAAEIDELAHICGLAIGESIERITFAWNPESTSRLLEMQSSNTQFDEPDEGQDQEEMRLYPADGEPVRLTVVPPAPHSGRGSHLAPPATS